MKVSGGVREPISDDGSKFIITSNDRESELVISAFDNKDVGTYHCIAENSVGSDTALVRLDLCPPEVLPCPLDADPSFFNVSVQITEGLNDTCTYCATWQVSQYGLVSWLVTTSGVLFGGFNSCASCRTYLKCARCKEQVCMYIVRWLHLVLRIELCLLNQF